MFKYYKDCLFTGSSVSWIAIAALAVSLLSIFFSFYNLYLSKRLEILNNKFQRFCIQNLDALFIDVDKMFNSKAALNAKIKQKISSSFTDIESFLLALKTIYPDIEYHVLNEIIEAFTDEVYATGNNTRLGDLKSNFYITKLSIYDRLYHFALYRELSLFARLGFKNSQQKSVARFPQLIT